MKLNIVSCTTGVHRYAWETFVLLDSLREFGYSDSTYILVWIPKDHVHKPKPALWEKLEKTFPEVVFQWTYDHEDFGNLGRQFNYNPIFRPYILAKLYASTPNLKDEAIFYIDSDIVFTKKFDFSPYLQDDKICYLSDTNSYINAAYFDSKKSILFDDAGDYKEPEFVAKAKWKEFLTRDILAETASFAGITRDICVKNNQNSGGAQYLLKGIDTEFWEDVIDTTINVRNHLRIVNEEFMRNDNGQSKEDNGFQSWCADMWGVLWNLWKRGLETRTPKELDFTWATDVLVQDGINKLEKNFLFHNAGITGDAVIRTNRMTAGVTRYIDAPAFYKGAKEFETMAPYDNETFLNQIISHEVSKEYGTAWYAEKLLNLKHKYSL